MRNIAVFLKYLGTAYHGWQMQKDLPTVQETMEKAIGMLTGEKVHVTGCGRTDAGVHAMCYVANFRTESTIPVERLPYALNTHLPPDIVVTKAFEVHENFNAIGSCSRKEYTYQIQPNLPYDDELYIVSVSKMGRPYDDIFYEPNWDDYTYMTGWDARRGFTYSGGFDGNWYLHYEEGSWQSLDINAPAVKGTTTVTRTSEWESVVGGRQANFTLKWDLYDDTDQANNITGEWSGPIVAHLPLNVD